MPNPIDSKLRHLPAKPGVYLFKDAEGEILYVGKAKSLRGRVRSYFGAQPQPSLKNEYLIPRIADVDTIVTDSEPEALMLENTLIKEHQPRFNVNLRDDKTYPYIKVTVQEPFPRVFVTRRLAGDGARYFGPYTDVGRMRGALGLIRKVFTVRSCRYRLPDEAPDRACLDYHIGQCRAPCVGLQSEAEYREMTDEIVDLLEGRTQGAAARLRARMAEAVAGLRFEEAARLRDALTELSGLEADQKVVDVRGGERDVVGFARDGEDGCAVVMRIRSGALLGRETRFLGNLTEETDEDAMAAFATRYYAVQSAELGDDVPPEVLFPFEFEDRETLEELISARTGRSIRTRVPMRGEKRRLIELAERNARHLLEERRLLDAGEGQRAPDALYELQEELELHAVPRSIACFDVSHTSGTETVGACSFFENGMPKKDEYRRFRIRGEWGNDDYRSMHEIVGRYVRRRIEEGRPLPDLIVIDGGKGQLSAAQRALEEAERAQQAIVGLAKRDEEVFLPGRGISVRLSRRSPALRLLQRARDEAHRFAIGYNRRLRSKRTVRSELDDITGIGPARRRRLLEWFGSVRALRDASEDEIARVPGFGRTVARRVKDALAAAQEEGWEVDPEQTG